MKKYPITVYKCDLCGFRHKNYKNLLKHFKDWNGEWSHQHYNISKPTRFILKEVV
jgi:hypothetical protein